jgi:hypothetical protein
VSLAILFGGILPIKLVIKSGKPAVNTTSKIPLFVDVGEIEGEPLICWKSNSIGRGIAVLSET